MSTTKPDPPKPTILHFRIERSPIEQKGVKRMGRGDRLFVTFPGMPEMSLPGVVNFHRHDDLNDIATRLDLELIATTEEVWVDPEVAP